MKRILFSLGFALLVFQSMAQLKFTYVNPVTNEITIRNYGSTTINISTYRFCALFEYTSLSQPQVSIVAGDLNLSPDESVTVAWNSSSGFNTTSSDLLDFSCRRVHLLFRQTWLIFFNMVILDKDVKMWPPQRDFGLPVHFSLVLVRGTTQAMVP